MKFAHKQLILVSLLASIGIAAQAQTPAPATSATSASSKPAEMRHHMGDSTKMQERHTKRLAALKEKLKLSPSQEADWTTFTSGMPTPTMGARPGHEAMGKLSTPQRLEKMKEMRTEHAAVAEKRAAVVKTFYATLTPEQQKTFDAETHRPRGGAHGGAHGKGGHGQGMHPMSP